MCWLYRYWYPFVNGIKCINLTFLWHECVYQVMNGIGEATSHCCLYRTVFLDAAVVVLSVTILFSYWNPTNRLEFCKISLVVNSNGKEIGTVSTYLSISGLVVNTFGLCILFCFCLRNVYLVFMYVYLLFAKCAQFAKIYLKIVDLGLVIFS